MSLVEGQYIRFKISGDTVYGRVDHGAVTLSSPRYYQFCLISYIPKFCFADGDYEIIDEVEYKIST